MVLRIDLVPAESREVFQLTGRITSPDVQELKAQIANAQGPIALDLQQVRLVDLDAAHFLAAAERGGVELRNVPRYVREWIHLETSRLGELE